MKKMLLACLLFGTVFLTACGNDNVVKGRKELVCSQKVSVVDIDMIADFNDDKIESLELKYTMDLSSYSDEQISAISGQNMCSSVKSAMSDYTDAFTNCKQNIENKILVITADFDINKMGGADITSKTNIEDAKKAFESQNYTCVLNDK